MQEESEPSVKDGVEGSISSDRVLKGYISRHRGLEGSIGSNRVLKGCISSNRGIVTVF